MTHEAKPVARERDMLSSFLFVSVGVLLLMYGIDMWQEDELSAQQSAAAQLDQGALSQAGCAVRSAGHGGRDLLVRCSTRSAEQAASLAAESWQSRPVEAFERFAFRDGSHTLLCTPSSMAEWPTGCQERDLPTQKELQEARRRRSREP